MKSGIFENPNTRDLLYVAKDRTVRALVTASGDERLIDESTRNEFKVRARNKDQQVELEDGTLCNRVSDVPNGCTDPVSALKDVHYQRAIKADLADLQPGEKIVDAGTPTQRVEAVAREHIANVEPPKVRMTMDLPKGIGKSGWIDREALTATSSITNLRQRGFRVCHRQSARKHRKAGREVIRVPSIGRHAYAWRERA